jgi:transcriptional regulator with XRE-family HTH domain
MNSFGEVVRDARLAKGMTLRQLAKILGVSAAFLCDVEHDRRKPARDRLPEFAEALGVELNDLTRSDPRSLDERVGRLEHRVKMLEWRVR